MRKTKKRLLSYSLGISSFILITLVAIPFTVPIVALLPLVVIVACTSAQLLTYYLYTRPKEFRESELKMKQAELLEEAKSELDKVLDQAVELRRERHEDDGGRKNTEETHKN